MLRRWAAGLPSCETRSFCSLQPPGVCAWVSTGSKPPLALPGSVSPEDADSFTSSTMVTSKHTEPPQERENPNSLPVQSCVSVKEPVTPQGVLRHPNSSSPRSSSDAPPRDGPAPREAEAPTGRYTNTPTDAFHGSTPCLLHSRRKTCSRALVQGCRVTEVPSPTMFSVV